MDSLLAFFESMFSNVGAWDAIKTTLVLSFFSTGISAAIGIPLGLLLEKYDFRGKRVVLRINKTLMGAPPVVIGLLVYLLLMRRGPFGSFRLLFSIRAMVIAQTLIISPIITAMIYSYVNRVAGEIRAFAKTMGANEKQTDLLILREIKNEIYFAIVSGYGRSISEVGAVMLVGGNIKGKTRTMTTAISLLKSQGIFDEGIFLGLTLLAMAFILQSLADFFMSEDEKDENY